MRILVTGGAGFIGSRLARRLSQVHDVWVLDNLHAQVHGARPIVPDWNERVRFRRADIRDQAALAAVAAESRPEAVFHLAAETGTGQSFDEVARYCEVNITGTAMLIEALRRHGVTRRVVLASSRAVYGEGPYRRADGGIVLAPARDPSALRSGDFTVRAHDGTPLDPVPQSAAHGVAPASIYGSTKLMQEYLLLQTAAQASWTVAALRFQNVYGPGQSLRNPYTGVLSIFCSQILDGRGLDIYEDGAIVRDFVYVDDAVRALELALEAPATLLDVGSGRGSTILQVADILLKELGKAPPQGRAVTGNYRVGDVRHAVADITAARRELGWEPRTALEQGLANLARWSREQRLHEDPAP